MKTKILLPIILLMLCIGLVQANEIPRPVSGIVTIEGEIAPLVGVQLTCEGETINAVTDSTGHYLADVNQFDYCRAGRSTIAIRVCSNSESCVKTITSSSLPTQANFDVDKQNNILVGGISIGAGVLIALLTLLGVKQNKDISNLSKALIDEVLQSAGNVAKGKLQDVMPFLNSNAKKYALEQEIANKNRNAIKDLLN